MLKLFYKNIFLFKIMDLYLLHHFAIIDIQSNLLQHLHCNRQKEGPQCLQADKNAGPSIIILYYNFYIFRSNPKFEGLVL